jgi:hypothetical protein
VHNRVRPVQFWGLLSLNVVFLIANAICVVLPPFHMLNIAAGLVNLFATGYIWYMWPMEDNRKVRA